MDSTKRDKSKKRQLTLFSCSGPVRQKLVDSKNRVHYVPVDDALKSAITANQNVVELGNQCRRCGATFTNEQGLGGHMIHCDRYDLLSANTSRAPTCALSPDSRTSYSSSSQETDPSSAAVPQDDKFDGRRHNRGSLRRRRYSMQEKFNIIEQCDESISSDAFPSINTPTQYFQYYYRNQDACHK